ncbi:DUF7288 family protein [Salinilacihabitans rarus]|uniref:DUF7288 family protein n=1 Tax=Salinilacihabitans rarus TaxID=2961596 RepID=UPI0020C85044|nr:hypothetical protein [Salinilacihabitans rarus]
MRGTKRTDRGQAYTLEGFVGAMVVLMAVLFALQSVVITPTTGGPIDRTVQAQFQQEANDALVVAASDGDLSETVRYWNNSSEEFYGSDTDVETSYYTAEGFNETRLGAILEKRFRERGQNYNVELHAPGMDDPVRLVYQGRESSTAFTASYAVTLYDDQHLTAPGYEHQRLEDAEDSYPIPNEGSDHVYNVVEVRVIVW